MCFHKKKKYKYKYVLKARPKMARCHFHFILCVKAGHKAITESRKGTGDLTSQ